MTGTELADYLDSVIEVAKASKLTIGVLVEAAKVLEMRRANNLMAANGDIFDEQIAGIGDVLQRIAARPGRQELNLLSQVCYYRHLLLSRLRKLRLLCSRAEGREVESGLLVGIGMLLAPKHP